MRARRIIRVQPPAPLGEVIVAPAALTGRTEADTARAMTAALAEAHNTADMSNRWRQAFFARPVRRTDDGARHDDGARQALWLNPAW